MDFSKCQSFISHADSPSTVIQPTTMRFIFILMHDFVLQLWKAWPRTNVYPGKLKTENTYSICDIVDSKIYILQTFGRMIFNYIDNSMKVNSLNQIFLCGIDLFSSIKQKKRRYTVSTHHIHCLERSIII